MTVPDVSYTVEIAWTSTWLTPDASRVWTDVSDYVELDQGMSIDHGRSAELSTPDANTLSLTLNNADGRFTWGNASSPYYPNVKIGKPIRVTATVGGNDYVRFTGLVDEWPVEWPGESAGFATATITASSRLSRLGLSSPLAQTIDRVHLDLEPDHYWPLTEATGPTATDLGSDPSPMKVVRETVTFGSGAEDPVFDLDGRTAIRVRDTGAISAEIKAELATPITIPTGVPGGLTISLFAQTTNSEIEFTSGILAILHDAVDGSFSGSDTIVELALPYGMLWTSGSFYGTLWPTDMGEDFDVHHLAITVSSDGDDITVTGYFDGVEAGSDTLSAVDLTFDRFLLLAREFGAHVGRVGVWSSALTGAQIADLAASGLTGFSGDTTDERVERIAAWARVPAAEVATTASPVTLDRVAVEPSKAEPLMRDAEAAEAGVLYDDRDGNLVLKPRSARYDVSPALTVAFTSDLVKGYVPKVDRQGLANVGTGKGPAGNEFFYEDAASRDDYGDAEYSVETTALDPDEPFQLVAWRINGNAQPRPRVPAPEFSAIDFIGGSIAALLGLDVGSKLRLTDAPAQAPGATSADYFVEGYTEAMGVGTWTISPNLTPVTLEDSVLILDDATDGLLDTNVLAL